MGCGGTSKPIKEWVPDELYMEEREKTLEKHRQRRASTASRSLRPSKDVLDALNSGPTNDQNDGPGTPFGGSHNSRRKKRMQITTAGGGNGAGSGGSQVGTTITYNNGISPQNGGGFQGETDSPLPNQTYDSDAGGNDSPFPPQQQQQQNGGDEQDNGNGAGALYREGSARVLQQNGDGVTTDESPAVASTPSPATTGVQTGDVVSPTHATNESTDVSPAPLPAAIRVATFNRTASSQAINVVPATPSQTAPGAGGDVSTAAAGNVTPTRTASGANTPTQDTKTIAPAAVARGASPARAAGTYHKPELAKKQVTPLDRQIDIRSQMYSLDGILTTEDGFKSFQEFLHKELSDENILFWAECRDFAELAAHANTDAERRAMYKMGRRIFKTYCKKNAPRAVNLSSIVLHPISALFASPAAKGKSALMLGEKARNKYAHPTPETFLAAQTEVYGLMNTDSFRRYLVSPLFDNLLWNGWRPPVTEADEKAAAASAAASAVTSASAASIDPMNRIAKPVAIHANTLPTSSSPNAASGGILKKSVTIRNDTATLTTGAVLGPRVGATARVSALKKVSVNRAPEQSVSSGRSSPTRSPSAAPVSAPGASASPQPPLSGRASFTVAAGVATLNLDSKHSRVSASVPEHAPLPAAAGGDGTHHHTHHASATISVSAPPRQQYTSAGTHIPTGVMDDDCDPGVPPPEVVAEMQGGDDDASGDGGAGGTTQDGSGNYENQNGGGGEQYNGGDGGDGGDGGYGGGGGGGGDVGDGGDGGDGGGADVGEYHELPPDQRIPLADFSHANNENELDILNAAPGADLGHGITGGASVDADGMSPAESEQQPQQHHQPAYVQSQSEPSQG